jgi:hypothetical protein
VKTAMQKRKAWDLLNEKDQEFLWLCKETFGIGRMIIETESERYDSQRYARKPSKDTRDLRENRQAKKRN